MKSFTIFLGIDVGKDYLDIERLSKGDKDQYLHLPNTIPAIIKWIKGLDKASTVCVLEATGSYSAKVVHYLSQSQISLVVVNPGRSNSFTQAQGITCKDDRQAAHTLALMGQLLELPLYKQPSETMQKRQQLLTTLNMVQKNRQRLQSQIHALDQQVLILPEVRQIYETNLLIAEQQIQQLEELLNGLEEDDYDHQVKLICSIQGMGPVTAQALMVATGGLHHFENGGQLAKFAGVTPFKHFSGSSVKKTGRMTKRGNSHLRASLYMAALSARRYNLACKELFERLRAKGKPYKQAMVAVMNKLLNQAFAVVHTNTKFDNQRYLQLKN